MRPLNERKQASSAPGKGDLKGVIERLSGELSDKGGSKKGRPPQAERGPRVAELLGAVGYLLRRSNALSAELSKVDADKALGALGEDDVGGYLGGLSVDTMKQTLSKALDDAFEAALADAEAEQSERAASAISALAERDALASSLTAIKRWETRQTAGIATLKARREAFEASLGKVETSLRAGARALVPVNTTRRSERDALDESARAEAWWFTSFADRDDLLETFFGSAPQQPPAKAAKLAPAQGREAQRDARVASLVSTPPRRHVSLDELSRYDLGLSSRDEKQWVSAHAASCAACKQMLKAASDADRVIEELDTPAPKKAARAADAAPARAAEDVAIEHDQFRVLAHRTGRKLRLVIEPKGAAKLSSAQVQLGGITSKSKPRKTSRGLEFSLDLPARVRDVEAKVSVTIGDAAPVLSTCKV